jgi:hypothetical protein
MCENMAISKVLCSVSIGHYTESGNCSISEEEKGRCVLATCVSHRRQWETRDTEGGSPIYLTSQKRLPAEYSPRDVPCTNTRHARWHTYTHQHAAGPVQEAPHGAQTVSDLRSPSDYRMFKSW